MERLPPELLAEVCSLSDIRSLKKIRLVNTTCARIAAQYLFEGLCLSLIPTYLDRVTEVAFHPTLRFHVRTLYFDFDILDEKYADYKTWETTIDTREPIIAEKIRPKYPETTRWQCSQADLDRFHTKFLCLLASQKSLFDGQMDRVLLSVAFAMLPNLRTIESIENTCHDGAVATPYDSIKGYEKNWVAIISDIQRDTLLPDPFLQPSVSSLPGLTRPLASLLTSLGLARKQIRTMELNISWEFWKQKGHSGYERGVQPHICAAFQYLESLDVHLMVDAYDLEVALQGLMPPSISNFIGAAPGLRVLNLDFHCYEEEDDVALDDMEWRARMYPRARQLFATLTLPNLSTFRLDSCTLTEENLISFVRRHATTLKEFCMARVVLDNKLVQSTSWERTLKHIAPILLLDRAKLSNLVSDDIDDIIIAEDPDTKAYLSRAEAYCQGLTNFLSHRGQTDCPNIIDFARPVA